MRRHPDKMCIRDRDAAKREQEEREKFARRFNTAQLQEELAKSMRQIVAGIGKKQEDLVESSNIVQPSEKPVMQQEMCIRDRIRSAWNNGNGRRRSGTCKAASVQDV